MDQLVNPVEFDSLLARAPGNPMLWQQFLTKLTVQLNCDASILLVTDLIERANTQFLYSFNVSPDYRERYETRLNRLDVFNYYLSKNPLEIFFSQTWPEDGFEYGENRNEINGGSYRLGLSIPCNERHSLNLILNRDCQFDEEEQQTVRQFLQHILKPLTEAIHTEQLYKINSQLIYYLGSHFDAYIIIDSKLNILFSDPVYIDMIHSMDCIKIQNGKFGMHNPVIEQRLLKAIEAKRPENTIHNQCQSCQISIIPIASLENLYHWECCKDAFILSFVLDKNRNPAIDRLAEIYELSHCEAICALEFMQNPSIPDVAANTFRSQATVRNHLKHSMQKMQVHNQAALMKKLIALSSL